MIWEKQWELFAPNFKNGKAHIDLTPYGCPEILQLYPGPGFGDLSHPTTRIVLELMQPYIQNHAVLDIGCGSGILSLAAAAMGASEVYGYDIDPEAVEHAKKNATLYTNNLKNREFDKEGPQNLCSERATIVNRQGASENKNDETNPTQSKTDSSSCLCISRFQTKIHFSTKPPKKIPSILLMNMISSEQAEAWSVIEDHIPSSAILITSGILKEKANEYLDWRQRQGWKKKKQLSEKGWIGFIFTSSHPCPFLPSRPPSHPSKE